MILRDAAGSAIGHTEVIDTIDRTIHSIPTVYRPAINQTDAQAFIYAMYATVS